jgi:uncharacterized membrane protein YoaK (UPF0700 family)
MDKMFNGDWLFWRKHIHSLSWFLLFFTLLSSFWTSLPSQPTWFCLVFLLQQVFDNNCSLDDLIFLVMTGTISMLVNDTYRFSIAKDHDKLLMSGATILCWYILRYFTVILNKISRFYHFYKLVIAEATIEYCFFKNIELFDTTDPSVLRIFDSRCT